MRKAAIFSLLLAVAGGGGWALWAQQREIEAARLAAEEAQRRVEDEHRARVEAALAAIRGTPNRVGYHGQFGDEMILDYNAVIRGYDAFLRDFPDDRLPDADRAKFARALCASAVNGNGGTTAAQRSIAYGGCGEYRWSSACSANLDADPALERGVVMAESPFMKARALIFVVDDDDSVGKPLFKAQPPGGLRVQDTSVTCSDGLMIWDFAGQGSIKWQWDGAQLIQPDGGD